MIVCPLAHAQSVFIEDLTWMEVRDAIAKGAHTAIYYAGSTEQNGPHMVTGKHNFIARHVAGRIAARLGKTLIYPIMPFAPTGDAMRKTGHMRYPGSVSVSEETYAAVAADVAASARAAGFRNILLMGDHGDGQAALGKLARRLSSEWRQDGVRVFHIIDVYERSAHREREVLLERGLQAGGHAGLADTSSLMFLDRQRRWVRHEAIRQSSQANGVDGDPTGATAHIGQQLVELKIDSALTQIRRLLAEGADLPAGVR